MAGLEIIRQTVIRFACIGLKHERRIFPLGVVGERGSEWVSIPFPLCRRSTAYTVVNLIAVLYRIPPSSRDAIYIRIGLPVSSRIRRQRIVHHRNQPDGLRIRVVGFVRTLDLEHIILHQLLLIGIIDLPRQLLPAVVLKPHVFFLVFHSVNREITNLMIRRNSDRIGALNQCRVRILRTLSLHGNIKTANHIVAIH